MKRKSNLRKLIELYLIILFVMILCLSLSANGEEIHELHTIAKFGGNKSEVVLDTPKEHSLLYWNGDNIDVGMDIKYEITDANFILAEYLHSKVKGGKASNNNLRNHEGEYSRHSITGSVDDYKLTYSHRIHLLTDDSALFLTLGGFYKDIQNKSVGGYSNENDITSDYDSKTDVIKAKSRFAGPIIGLRYNYRPTPTTFSLQLDYMLPIFYQGEFKSLKSNTPSSFRVTDSDFDIADDFGIRVKYEKSFDVEDAVFIPTLRHIKYYLYYEIIRAKGLTSTSTETGRVVGGADCVKMGKCLSKGVASYKTLGAGLSFEF